MQSFKKIYSVIMKLNRFFLPPPPPHTFSQTTDNVYLSALEVKAGLFSGVHLIQSKRPLGKSTAENKDTIKGITRDSQVNSNSPYRWSPARLTLNICFIYFPFLYLIRRTIKSLAPHLKPPKQKSRLWTASNILLGREEGRGL